MSEYTRRNEADELRKQLSNCHDYIADLERFMSVLQKRKEE